MLGARNACALAANFLAEDIDVIVTDVLTPESAVVYRELLPGCRVVRLSCPAGRDATSRGNPAAVADTRRVRHPARGMSRGAPHLSTSLST